MQLLSEGEKSVSALASHFPVSRSAISQHLLLLVEVGLVTARKEGRNRYYRLRDEGVDQLQRMFDAFWSKELELLVTEAHRVHENKGEI